MVLYLDDYRYTDSVQHCSLLRVVVCEIKMSPRSRHVAILNLVVCILLRVLD
jgi:hypothetical protein